MYEEADLGIVLTLILVTSFELKRKKIEVKITPNNNSIMIKTFFIGSLS
tara:strand:- start:697 stop:843 length:147 start_codon:yes stop_codon:yes gene_type:complete